MAKSTIQFRNSYFTVKREVNVSRSFDYTYISFKRPGVRIIAQNDHNETLLVRQYRHPVRGYTWELPAGGMEEGETALASAKRELLEESGLAAESWVMLGKMISLPNVTDFTGWLFHARNLTSSTPLSRSSATEEVENFRFFSDYELQQLILHGEFCDEKSLAGLMMLRATSEVNSE